MIWFMSFTWFYISHGKKIRWYFLHRFLISIISKIKRKPSRIFFICTPWCLIKYFNKNEQRTRTFHRSRCCFCCCSFIHHCGDGVISHFNVAVALRWIKCGSTSFFFFSLFVFFFFLYFTPKTNTILSWFLNRNEMSWAAFSFNREMMRFYCCCLLLLLILLLFRESIFNNNKIANMFHCDQKKNKKKFRSFSIQIFLFYSLFLLNENIQFVFK